MKNLHLLLAGESYLSLNCSYRDSAIGTEVGKPYWTYSKDWKHYLSVTDASVRPHNIYITSDEEIKDSYVINTHTNDIYFENWYSSTSFIKKIILTTDQELIKDGVQAIPDDFLEWFVKNPSCEEVNVKKGFRDGTAYGYNFLDYKIIIPKEELERGITITHVGKQETLEEFANKTYPFYGDVELREAIELGAKWQQEIEKQQQGYSEEEVELIANEMVNWAIDNIGNPFPQSGKKFDEVIAKFKNK